MRSAEGSVCDNCLAVAPQGSQFAYFCSAFCSPGRCILCQGKYGHSEAGKDTYWARLDDTLHVCGRGGLWYRDVRLVGCSCRAALSERKGVPVCVCVCVCVCV